MDKIKPFPFCGNENADVDDWETYAQVTCGRCDAAGPCCNDVEEAIERWNAVPRKEDAEMKKSCENCVHISKEVEGKVYCCEKINIYHSCKYWEALNPFENSRPTCLDCKHRYYSWGEDNICNYCCREIWNPEGYVCDSWEAKGSKSTPLNTENSSGLKTLCEKAISKWGEAAQINKAIEELLELVIALTQYQNLNLQDKDYQEKAYKILDNIQEEREDVEIMLRQLDSIFGRSDEWQRKKYEHLRQIVREE